MMRELLKKLCAIPAVSGREDALRDFIIKEVSPFADCKTDKNGNLICFKKGRKSPEKKVMLDAHMDEVGIIAAAFTSDGFVKFTAVGGIDVAVMMGRSVIFENGVRGVIGVKPVHLLSAEEKKKLPDKDTLYIDIGATDKAEAERLINLGDTAVFESEITLLGENKIKARALDDRAGVAILISLLKNDAEYDFYGVFSIAEEVGCRGAKTATYAINPDAAIILESTTAADLHGASEENTVCCLGDGPAVSFMDGGTLYDRRMFDAVKALGLKMQVKRMVSGSNDSSAIHLTRDGVPTITISLPTRYIHSPSSIADLRDFDDMLPLALAMLEKVASGQVV